MSDVFKLSPLDEEHRKLAGRMVPFAGWEMPIRYDSIIAEHRAVRESCGVFDISHMGQIFVSGSGSEAYLERLLTNDVASLEPGNGHYTFMLNDRGGVIDDLLLYRLGQEDFLLLVNASCVEEDHAWLKEHLSAEVELENGSADWGGLAVQGPRAAEVYTALTGGRTLPKRNGIDDLKHEGERFLVSRTGYTGEDGFELFCPSHSLREWWLSLLSLDVKACGLGARDSLRLEMCYPLNGADLTPSRTPLEAGLGFFVSLDKGEFIGSEALRAKKENPHSERLMAIELSEGSAPPRAGYPVLDEEGNPLGELSSGGLSLSLGKGIGLAYLAVDRVQIGDSVMISVRGKKIMAKVVKKPFYRK